MSYNPYDRSELELRFEKLFQETFHCHVEDILTPQYPLEVEDRYYRIDYAFVSERDRIAIELDGHSKIRNAADSSKAMNDLFTRQNDIMHAGFKVYRFTWSDVVADGGWKARKQLQQIFKGKFPQGRRKPKDVPVWKPENPNRPDIESPKSAIISSDKLTEQGTYPQTAATATIVDGVVVDSKKNQKLAAIIFVLIGVGLGFLEWNKPHPEAAVLSPATSAIAQPVSVTPSKETLDAKSSKPTIPKVVYVQVPVNPPKQNLVSKDVNSSSRVELSVDTALHPPASESLSAPVPTESTQERASNPDADEVVAFNQSSLIYHQTHCYWAKKCTKNCIYIPKSQAISLGGRPARSCDPR